MYEDSSSAVCKLTGKQIVDWCNSKVGLYPLTYEEAGEFLRRKWNRGVFQSTLFSVHPVSIESEQIENYGDRWFTPIGLSKIQAEISSNSQGMFLPSIYLVDNVRILEGLKIKDLREVCSYQGLYSDLLELGERMVARGKLEHVA